MIDPWSVFSLNILVFQELKLITLFLISHLYIFCSLVWLMHSCSLISVNNVSDMPRLGQLRASLPLMTSNGSLIGFCIPWSPSLNLLLPKLLNGNFAFAFESLFWGFSCLLNHTWVLNKFDEKCQILSPYYHMGCYLFWMLLILSKVMTIAI